jgi:ABC-type sugar transport system ATPase subunit
MKAAFRAAESESYMSEVGNAQLEPAVAAGSDGKGRLLVAEHLTKRFPGVLALDDVSFSIGRSEIVALLGQNGAGKSTLIQILAGVHPSGTYLGEITLAGEHYRPTSIVDAEEAGIALVPQEVNVVPDLSIAENLCLNAEPRRWGLIDVPGRLARARSALEDFGLDINPAKQMGSLDLATQQLVVIARALSKKARALILDEPTAALTENEARRLFERLSNLRSLGVAIVFVSHRLGEVFDISDRMVIMRDGRIRGAHVTRDVSRQAIIADMIGNMADANPQRDPRSIGPPAVEVRDLVVFDVDAQARRRVHGLHLTLRKGEIVGLFGLLGAGCIESALAIYGAWLGEVAGQVRIDGHPVVIDSPATAVLLGLGLMAQDRRDCLIPDQSVGDNIVLASLDRSTHHGFLDVADQHRRALEGIRQLDIKTASRDVEVRKLSGGNQQKVQIARWLAASARILILVDPTRGVDVGARAEIKRIWSELSQSGHSILIASTDAEELVDVCDKVVIMRHGHQIGALDQSNLTEENLLRMAADV